MGKGAAVGAVIPCVAAIIPAAVGVDIGCGMIAGMFSAFIVDRMNVWGRAQSPCVNIVIMFSIILKRVEG